MSGLERVQTRALRMSGIRALFGGLAIAAPELTARVVGFPRDHVNATGKIFGGLFGVRELALAAIVMGTRDDPRNLRAAIALNAACDLGDAAIVTRALLRREGVDRGAVMSLTPALIGAVGWLGLLRELEHG